VVWRGRVAAVVSRSLVGRQDEDSLAPRGPERPLMRQLPTERDLFAEEQAMPSMSFGDHIEELRARLILAIVGLAIGTFVAFIPFPTPWGSFTPGQWVFDRLLVPAEEALREYDTKQVKERSERAIKDQAMTGPFEVRVSKRDFARVLREIAPDLKLPPEAALEGESVTLPLEYKASDWINSVHSFSKPRTGVISLSPLETFMSFFLVGLVTGLVLASPWVFYQLWQFVAAGLYRHERYYVMKFLPFSLGLFLGGVLLCFFSVLPFTLKFLFEFNEWLKIEPNLRLTDWMGFATFLPLVFGVCFQTPLVMMLLERIGVFTLDDFRKKRKIALLAIVIAAAAITPTGDPLTLSLLAGPMYALYELGIRMIANARARDEGMASAKA
jgi:sec-independent protein translocase protein TatC